MTSREQQIIDRIEKAKTELAALRAGRKLEIGQLAYTCGIAELSNTALKTAFTALATAHAEELATRSGTENSNA